MLNTFSQFGFAAVLVMLLGTLCFGKGAVITIPAAYITACGLFMKPLILTWKSIDELN